MLESIQQILENLIIKSFGCFEFRIHASRNACQQLHRHIAFHRFQPLARTFLGLKINVVRVDLELSLLGGIYIIILLG